MKKAIQLCCGYCLLFSGVFAQSSFYLDSLSYATAVFSQDAIYFHSSTSLAKSDYNGNVIWERQITGISKIEVGSDVIYGLAGLKVFKLDSAGNTIWVKSFYSLINTASSDSNYIGDLVYDGSHIFLSAIQSPPPWATGVDYYPSILTLDTAGNVLQVSADHVITSGGFSLQPCIKAFSGGAWIGYNYQPGFTHHSIVTRIDTSGNYMIGAFGTEFFFSTVTYIKRIVALPDSTNLVVTYSENYNYAVPQGFFTLSKIADTGIVLWQNSYWNNSFTCGLHVTETYAACGDSSGNIYVIGNSSEYPCVGIPSGGPFYMKLDSQGNILWIKSSTGLSQIGLSGPGHYYNGKIYCQGTYHGKTAIVVLDTLFEAACFSPDSALVLNKDPATIYSGPVMTTPPVISYVPLADTLTNSTINIFNSLDLCMEVSIYSPPSQVDAPLALYPNPTTGKFAIQNHGLIIESVGIYTLFGENVNGLVSIRNLHSALSPEIDVSSLTAGVYFICASSRSNVWRIKMVKQ